MPSLVGLGFHPPSGRQKTMSFLSVCVRHAFECQRLCARLRQEGVGVQKQFWWRWIGKVCSCASCSTFSDCRQLATPQNAAEVNKVVKCRVIADRFNYTGWNKIWRVSVDHWSALAHQIALIGKKGSVQESPNVNICTKLFLATGSRHIEHI